MTRTAGAGCGLFLLLGWATGCRSERVAFQFQPVSPHTVAAASDTIANETTGETAHLARLLPCGTLACATLPVPQHRKQHKPPGSGPNPAARCPQLLPQRKLQFPAASGIVAKPRGSIDDSPWGGIMFLLGGVICVAAVIIGINLGGVLGLVAGTVSFFVGSLAIAFGYAGPDKPDPSKPKSETGIRPYLTLLIGLLATVLLLGGGLGLLFHGGASYLAATLTGAAMYLPAAVCARLKSRSASNHN